jgi:glucose-1-phosphate cytidylyltransferase
MQTIIFCGGLGTRLREETEFKPKPMVKIGDRPILWHIMKIYASYGHKEFILPLGYHGHMIKEFFFNYELINNDVSIKLGKQSTVCMHNCHDEEGWKIICAETGEHTLKGARLKCVEKYVEGDTFMLTYGDGVADIDIDRLLDFHKSHGRIATVTGVNPLSRFGELVVEGDTVESFMEKPKEGGEGLISGGFFVFNRKIFDYLKPVPDCDLERGPLEELANAGELKVYRHEGFWFCMDTLRDVDSLQKMWRSGNAPWRIW